MKSYIDIEQSKKLAKILPLESADMHYVLVDSEKNLYSAGLDKYIGILPHYPAWSLVALFDILPKIINNETLFIETSASLWHIGYRNIYTARADNPIDACVAMIEKLHELKML